MKLVKKWWGSVTNKKLKLDDQEGFMQFYKTLEGKEVELELKPKRDSYGLQQMRYLYGGVYEPISEYTGIDPVSLDIYLKEKFWFTEKIITDKDGKKHSIQSPVTKTKMDTKDLSEYIKKVSVWSFEFLGVRIPTPKDYYEI